MEDTRERALREGCVTISMDISESRERVKSRALVACEQNRVVAEACLHCTRQACYHTDVGGSREEATNIQENHATLTGISILVLSMVKLHRQMTSQDRLLINLDRMH